MSQGEKDPASLEDERATIRVNDRRRFDMDGNVRADAEPQRADEPEREARPSATARPSEDAEAMQLRQDLEVARKRVDELARAFQALSNDREDFKQRLTRERERMVEVERGHIAETLLEVLDELDRSLQASGPDDSPLAQGVQLIRDGLLKKIQAMGIERLDLVGQPYDPNLAEATDVQVTTVPDDDQKVVSEVRAGYRSKDRIIRPAQVKVARYMKPAEA